jgi:hypothetical protein
VAGPVRKWYENLGGWDKILDLHQYASTDRELISGSIPDGSIISKFLLQTFVRFCPDLIAVDEVECAGVRCGCGAQGAKVL